MGTPMPQTVPTLDELQAWARDPSREKWRNLIAALTDLFVENIDTDNAEHGEAYAEVVCRMLDQVATEVRKELSERVAPIERFPGRVVRRLASDEEAEVATPMLEHSPVLTEKDLITVIEMMMPDHNKAISKRKQLNEKLTDALVKRGDVETVRSMTANPGAKFSPKTYRIVAERAKTDVGLQESLVSREDLTHVITCQITPFLSEELKARLRALEAPPEGGSLLDSLTEIASESERKAKARKERAAVYSIIEQVLSGGANASEETVKLVESARRQHRHPLSRRNCAAARPDGDGIVFEPQRQADRHHVARSGYDAGCRRSGWQSPRPPPQPARKGCRALARRVRPDRPARGRALDTDVAGEGGGRSVRRQCRPSCSTGLRATGKAGATSLSLR